MQIKIINTQKVLSPTQVSLADYVINPYRGCEFGCLYCYSQENKNIKSSDFFETLGIKIYAPEVLERELRYKKPKRVLFGSTTECFQYAELKYRLMDKILNLLNTYNIPYTILTKSHLVVGYLPVIAQNHENKIYFTFNCASDSIIQLLEKKSPNIKQRVKTLEAILEKNISLRVHIGPFIPYLSSLEEVLKKLSKSVKEIDIELYHHKMGNFEEILKATRENINDELAEKLAFIYKNEENYLKFAEELKEEIVKLIKKFSSAKFFYIVPDFNKFYSPNIDYDKVLSRHSNSPAGSRR
jgi:DNA repair photolyase